jgi:hypothetical protein
MTNPQSAEDYPVAPDPTVGASPPYNPNYPNLPPYPQFAVQPMSPVAFGHLQPAQPKNGLGITALVCGIVGLCFTFTYFLGPWVGGPLSVLAIIFGAIGRKRANRGEATNKTMATWGLSLGIVACVVAVVELITFFALVGAASTSVSKCDQAISNAVNNPQNQAAQDAVSTDCN